MGVGYEEEATDSRRKYSTPEIIAGRLSRDGTQWQEWIEFKALGMWGCGQVNKYAFG